MVRVASLPSAVTVPSKSSVSTQFRISSLSSVRSAYSLRTGGLLPKNTKVTQTY